VSTRPHLFFDENVSHVYVDALRPLLKRATMSSHRAEKLTGLADVDLFDRLSPLGFGAIVTLDSMQLRNEDELAGLRRNKLHWIGLSTPDGRGMTVHSQVISSLMFGLPQVLDDWRDEPHSYHLPVVTSRSSALVTARKL